MKDNQTLRAVVCPNIASFSTEQMWKSEAKSALAWRSTPFRSQHCLTMKYALLINSSEQLGCVGGCVRATNMQLRDFTQLQTFTVSNVIIQVAQL